MKDGNLSEELLKDLDLIGDNHIMTSIETPLREDAFQLSDQEKIDKKLDRFRQI